MKVLALLAASLLFGLAGAVCARAADPGVSAAGAPVTAPVAALARRP